jgi:hypothetical protein
MADEKFKRLVKSMPGLYRPEVNTMIGGLLKAWGLSDDDIVVQLKETKKQIFETDASDRYLDYLANNVGVSRTAELGIEDEDFRNLIPVLSYYPKQVRQTIIALLDVFWGAGFTRPNINSGNIEPFDFSPVSTLTGLVTFEKDNKLVKGSGTLFLSEVQPGQYIKAASSSGYLYAKVSAVISDTLLALSSVPADMTTQVNVTAVVADVRELEYEVDNGDDRRKIRFKPSSFDDITAVTIAELVEAINSDPEHNKNLTASSFIDPLAGNKLNLRTNTPGLQGSIQIIGGDANAPTRLNFSLVKQVEAKAAVYEINPNEIVVRIPSSVPVLRRKLQGSAHPKQTKTELFSNLATYDFASLGGSSSLNLTVDSMPYVVTFNHATDFADATAATAEEVAEVINNQLLYLQAFSDGITGRNKVGLRTTEGSMEYQVTGGTANTVLGFSTALQQDPDMIVANYPSAYIFDPTGQLFTVTGNVSDLTAQVDQGVISPTLSLNNASSFPNQPGLLLLNFGRNDQEGPISYNSRPNNSTLLIDASYIFQKEHVIGTKVNYVANTPTIPRITGDDYAVYVTGTQEARNAAQELIKKLLAAGVVVRFIIEFPEVLFECMCQSCRPSDSPDQVGSRTGLPPLTF